MKLIEPKVELIQQQPGLVGMYKHIEKCARTCYKSEDKITENSYKKMYDNLVKRGHLAMLEHGTIYLMMGDNELPFDSVIYTFFDNNPYSIHLFHNGGHYITTNLRVLVEHNILDSIQEYVCEPTKHHERRLTLKFIANIGVTREGNRHRVFSIAEQSTRYCNYNNADKFGEDITFIKPTWVSKEQLGIHDSKKMATDSQILIDCKNYTEEEFQELMFLNALSNSEVIYKLLIKSGWSPQQAREVLPLATKSEVVYTAFASDWKHWFDLRLVGTTGKPHPNMEQVAWLAQQELIKNNLWDLIYDPNNKSDKV